MVSKPTGIKGEPITTIETFAKTFTIAPNGCWPWIGPLSKHKYGAFRINGVQKKAHRVAWEMVGNTITPSLVLDHTCHTKACNGGDNGDNCLHRRCVNPKHLEEVTIAVNNFRGNGIANVYRERTHCSKGHPYDTENTYIRKGRRYCRTCVNLARRKYRPNKAAALARQALQSNLPRKGEEK